MDIMERLDVANPGDPDFGILEQKRRNITTIR